MKWRFDNRRSLGLAAVSVIAALVVSFSSPTLSRGDDNSVNPPSGSAKADATGSQQTNGSAKTVVDPFVVPDGNAQVLLKFITKVRSVRAPHKQSAADAQAFMVAKCGAIIAAADKILSAEPKGNVHLSALQSKLQALSALDDTGDDKAGTDLAALIDELKSDKQPGMFNLTKRYSAEAEEVTSATTAPKIEIKGSHLDGTAFDPSTTKRKVTLVELWLTTCGRCQAEMPNLARDYAKYRNRGFEVVGINLDGNKAAVQKYVQENPSMAWQILIPNSGFGVSYPGQKLGQIGTPTMILVNRRGAILSDNVTDAELTAKLAALLGP